MGLSVYIYGLLKRNKFLESIMARRCQVTGKGPQTGNNVSHAHNVTKRRWLPNLQTKRFYIPEEGRWVKLRVSANAMKTIDKKGIGAVVRELRAQGQKV